MPLGTASLALGHLQGRPIYGIGLVEDVTDQKRAEAVEFERARLEGVLLAARTMQHELNNRLALVVGYAEILNLEPTIPDHLREATAEMLRGGREASSIINQLGRVTEIEPCDWGPGIGATINLPGC